MNKKQVECDICGKSVTGIYEHRKTHRSREGIPCKECGKILFGKTSLISHQLVHQEPKYNCKYCELKFTQGGSLKRHKVQVHGIVEGNIGKYGQKIKRTEMYTCKECNIEILESNADFHMFKEHGIKNAKVMQKHLCTICGKIMQNLIEHKRFTHNIEGKECIQCKKVFKYSNSLKSHIQEVHSDVYYPCNICDKKYKQKFLLDRHMAGHLDKEKHKCTICGRGFALLGRMNLHMKIHLSTKEFECNICKNSFKTIAYLRSHQTFVHSSKSYKCNECDKCYKNEKILNNHVNQVHNEQSIHNCDKCTSKFKQRRMLLQHLRYVHEPKKFICRFGCKTKFALKTALNVHIKHVHEKYEEETTYACHICSKEYKRKKQYKAHLQTHGEKKYECQTCGAKFSGSSALKGHIITHTKLKPFKCTHCEKSFNNSGSRSRHIQKCVLVWNKEHVKYEEKIAKPNLKMEDKDKLRK